MGIFGPQANCNWGRKVTTGAVVPYTDASKVAPEDAKKQVGTHLFCLSSTQMSHACTFR